jgi:hypothetical protein
MANPTRTGGADGNVRTSASLAANTSETITTALDFSAKPGGTVAATRGVRCEFLPRYGTTPTTTTLPAISYDLPSAAASTAESKMFYLGTGLWALKLTNLDASNAVTVEVTADNVALP